MPDALLISDLVVTLGGRSVLTELSLTAPTGQITALLGPNGAGKTTLVRCCTGLITADRGTITLLGHSPGEAPVRAKIGVMPQHTGAWSGVRVRELLTYLASLYAHPQPVEALITRLGMHDYARTPYRRLSGGQKQAVNLAGAMIGRPELVFLDEPTAGMDPHARRRTWQLVRDLRAAGVTIVLTTHDMTEAEELADQVVLLDAGRVVRAGSTAALAADGGLEELFLACTQDMP